MSTTNRNALVVEFVLASALVAFGISETIPKKSKCTEPTKSVKLIWQVITVKGKLILQDGTIFHGQLFGGSNVTAEGEVVFNTGMTGY